MTKLRMIQTTPDSDADGLADLAEAKAALRQHMRGVRAEASAQGEAAAQALKNQTISQLTSQNLLKDGVIIAGYRALTSELDPALALGALQEAGTTVALPVTGEPGEPLIFRVWRTGDPLAMGRFGTLEPAVTAPQVEPDVVLTPLLAFDAQGNRLGFGGGYYDRTLAELRQSRTKGKSIVAYGVGFDQQEVPQVPTNALDARLDGVLTPSRFISAL